MWRVLGTEETSVMPIYEYKCSQCAKKLEIIQRVSDPPLQSCPDCSGKLEKL
ncbi:MAG TPA: zinc ribbon domain-containing protein, partial [bacterium]|nr:zinc ribbon domain-containing protein [bacterium]